MRSDGRTTVEYLVPEPGQWFDLQRGLQAVLGPQYILVAAKEPWITISSGVIGGGLSSKRYFTNRQVNKDYWAERPAEEMAAFLTAAFQGYNADWAALMTAALVNDACWVRLSQQDHQVTVIVTAGVDNACTTGVTPFCVLESTAALPVTINIMAFLSHVLSPGAMVNAVQTATEAKTQILRELRVMCSATGAYASGTNTDALIIAAANTSAYPYAGPGTLMGYLLALGVRKALLQAVEKYLMRKES